MLEHKDYPYKFDETKCESCEGNCCIGESGYIWITKNECEKLSKLLNITVSKLNEEYLFKIGYRYSIKEKQISKNSYACVFFDLDKKRCGVYEARPIQCKTFPFWEYFKNNIKEVKEECPAILDL
ncbi:MAG: YkgJ family cysteine cluster protein [Campylobacterota bacterium]|nr:YkgJ family cysteine cluster protein [Campylobacterota bacterium]